MASFYSRLLTDAVLPADIRTALSLTDADSVYGGRQPRPVPQRTEVWVERLETVDRTRRLQRITEHRYRLNVRLHSATDGARTGSGQLDTVEGHMRTLVERYDGKRPFTGTLTDLISVQASEDAVDAEDEQGRAVGVVRLSFFVEGSGST